MYMDTMWVRRLERERRETCVCLGGYRERRDVDVRIEVQATASNYDHSLTTDKLLKSTHIHLHWFLASFVSERQVKSSEVYTHGISISFQLPCFGGDRYIKVTARYGLKPHRGVIRTTDV